MLTMTMRLNFDTVTYASKLSVCFLVNRNKNASKLSVCFLMNIKTYASKLSACF